MPSSVGVSPATSVPVRVRWKAKGALTVSLYQNNSLVPGNFRPSDEHETTIVNNSIFRVVADYGNGETAEKATNVNLNPQVPSVTDPSNPVYVVETLQASLWDAKPPILELDGQIRGFQSFFSTINSLLNSPDGQADVSLKITLKFKPALSANASDISSIKQTLERNPVERLN